MTKILIIDDSESLLETLKAYLGDRGYIICTADNGREGLEVFHKELPQLVLADLHMPELAGLEVLKEISKSYPDVPVIMISGAGEIDDAIQALRLGAADFIIKPIVDLQVLDYAIDKALERQSLIIENKEFAAMNELHLNLLREDQVAGRRLQRNLLPDDHVKVGDFEFKFSLLPSLDLSGDFVEYYRITEDQYGVYLADVSGHGASSAFITILLKSIVSQYLSRHTHSNDQTILYPEKIMRAISNELFAAKLNKYITLIYGVVNIKTGAFTYGVGGHYPSPILRKANGEVAYLPGQGFPLGIIKDVEYKVETAIIDSGDRVVMFSDGVMEVYLPNKTLPEKDKGLLSIVGKEGDNISGISKALGISIDAKFRHPDDITILTIGRD